MAEATAQHLRHVVPPAVPGIASPSRDLASAGANVMNMLARSEGFRLPWALAFSFARAIMQPALNIRHGQDANVPAAQQAPLHRANCNRSTVGGEYGAAMEPA